MLLWYHEGVDGRLGIYVLKGKSEIVLVDDPGRNLFLDNLAKNTVSHKTTGKRLWARGNGYTDISIAYNLLPITYRLSFCRSTSCFRYGTPPGPAD